ncbi:MAG TPA: cohesin domain-containing protein [Terriglobales bacterium]|nr:cohesin domain-containing protein [Terriglobales bacterium]
MRRLIPLSVVFIMLTAALLVVAESAKSLWQKGQDAEARQNYEQAYEFYRQAYEQKPKELRYRASYERTKFLAAASHVHRGQVTRDGGKLNEALAEFQKALEIDPSSFIAQQEIRRTQQMIQEGQGSGPQASTSPPNALRRRLSEAAGPVELAPISNIPITLKMTDDSKVAYETIGKLAGINVLFDPDYTPRRIKIELNGVTLEEALEIVSLESKTFWRPVTPNTIFVAADNPGKRKELEQSVIKTFYLANLSQPTELQDIVNAMRTILEVSRIQQLPSQGAIVVRGTPDQLALAQKLVDDLDKAKAEVIVEVAVMQVSRDKMRNLGISPPTTASVALQPNVTTSTTGTNNTTSTTSGSTANTINLNRLGDLNATDFQVTIPPASATALLSDSTTKIIQNPQIRALDGQKASLKIGDRVPVATGSFQPGIGGVGINPLVNTQFQYLDVGVNIDITPRVHATREVTLKIALDISAVTSRVNIGGIDQPVIGQRKVEHEIRLRDGEVNLLGGILEDQQTRALSGIPGLAQIPLLKYLFSQTNTEHRENEIVFVLVPHIIRGQELSRSNQDAIDVGTANALELRHINKTVTTPVAAQPPASAAAPAPAPQQSVPANAPQASPGQTPTSMPATTPPAANPPNTQQGSASFLFDPPTITQAKGSTFTVNLLMSGAQNVYSVPVQVNYDPNQLEMVNVSNGGFLSQDGQPVALVHRDDPTTGSVQITATRPPGAGGVSGQGGIVTLTFMAKGSGQSAISVTRGGARDPAMQAIPVSGAQAGVTIQ